MSELCCALQTVRTHVLDWSKPQEQGPSGAVKLRDAGGPKDEQLPGLLCWTEELLQARNGFEKATGSNAKSVVASAIKDW